MNARMCGVCVPREKTDNWEDLKVEYECVKRHMREVEEMDLSPESTFLVITELIARKNEIKERMHNYIDTL